MTAAPESHVSSEEAPSSSPSSNNNNNNNNNNNTKKSKGMSKRQRRKAGPNPINTLPQQPKIKTMDARNKAYLRQAGFTSSSSSTNKSKDKKKSEDSNPLDPRRELFPEEETASSLNTSKNQPWVISSSSHTKKKQRTTNDTDTATATPATTTKEEQSQDLNSTAEMKFGRLLASPDAKIRHKTLLKLQAYIKAKCAPPPPPANDTDENDSNAASSSSSPIKGFSHLDLMKLWKALWHTLYLCDGVVVQEEVSKVLAELLWCFAGTPEEDEYVSRLYLEMEEANENSMEGGDDDNDEEAPTLVDCGDANDDELDEKLIREIREKLKDVEEVSMEDSDDEDEEGMSSSEENEDAAAAAAAVDGAIRNDGEEDDNDDDDNDDDDVDMENDKHCRGAHLAALYFRTYLITLTREWPNMDKYRIDKFYTLTRMMLREVYRYMAKRHWTLGVVHIFNDALMEEVLQTNKTGNGIRFHIIDMCLEELANVNSEDDVTTLKLTEAIILDVLQPYLSLAQLVEEAIVHKKVMDKVLTRFLEEYSVVSSNYDPENTDGESNKLIMDQVHVGTVAQFIFSLAGDSVTLDWHRKKLYNMHKDYVRKIKTVGRDVCLEEEGDDDDMDVVDDEVEEKKDMTEKVDTIGVILSESPSSEQTVTEKAEPSPSNVKAEEEVQTESNSAKKKKSKKSKKKKSKHASSKAETSTPSDIPTDSISPPEQQESEDVITISVQDQKKAKKASALRKSKKAEKQSKQRHEDDNNDGPSTPPETPGDSRVKKVKFSRTNRAKSHNKSMKDLRKVDAKATLERTPEKSILLSKKRKEEDGFETPVADGKKKKRKGTPHPKKRKNAMDFF